MSITSSIDTSTGPTVINRSEHPISRANISSNALKVLYRLKDAGYQGHLVGGGVRDLLLGREPKDFDIATDAHPDDVRRLFGNCRLIGRRFRLAHVMFGREVIEVARKVTGHPIPSTDADRRPGDPAVLIAGSDRIQQELGWQARYEDLETIIKTAWIWHKKDAKRPRDS